MAARTSPAEARKLAATALQRVTAAGAPPAYAARLAALDRQLDSTIAAYQAATSSRVGVDAAAQLLDALVDEIRSTRDDALAEARRLDDEALEAEAAS